jgi:RimJ/RimL family protein N-acetyltransferase
MSDESTQPVYLRALEMDDLDRTHLWHNDRSLYESLAGSFRYVSRAAEAEWLRSAQSASPQHVNLAICLAATSEHVGNIYLRDIDWIARHAELHIFVGDPQQRGKGYGRAAVGLLTAYAFRDLGLRRVYLFVLADNLAAIRTYSACGFAQEGVLRNHAYKNSSFKDVLVMGICNETVS